MVSSTPCPKSETNPYIPPLFWKCRTKRSTSSNDTNPKHVTKPCRHKVRLTRFSRIDTAAGSTSSNGTNTKTSRKKPTRQKVQETRFSRIATADGSTSSNGTNTKRCRKTVPSQSAQKRVFHESTQPLFESDFGKDQQVHTMRSLRSVRKTVPCQSAKTRFFGNRHNRCFLVQKAQNRFCSRTRRKKSRIPPF